MIETTHKITCSRCEKTELSATASAPAQWAAMRYSAPGRDRKQPEKLHLCPGCASAFGGFMEQPRDANG